MEQTNSFDNQTRVLVVDDEPAVCRSVTKVLERKGYKVAEALCASSALDLLEKGETYDLLIVDLMMPQTNGVELLKIVRERWHKTPVLIITGYASIASAVETTKLGALGYLPKPFTPDELARAVEEVMSGPVPEVVPTVSLRRAQLMWICLLIAVNWPKRLQQVMWIT